MSYEFSESDIEEIIAKHPRIIEKGLTLKGRQVGFRGKRVDLLFTDKLGYTLIVELKKGFVKREDVGQLVEYYGLVNVSGEERVRVMLVGSVIPVNLQRGMDGHGIEYRELNDSDYMEFLKKNDPVLLEKIQRKQPPMPIISLPQPAPKAIETIQTKSGVQRFWIFQTNPRTTYRIFDWWSVIGDEDIWGIHERYQDKVHKGDMAAIWVAGKDDVAGIYRIAEILTNPEMILEPKEAIPFWIKEEDRKQFSKVPRLQVRIRYVKKLERPILRASIRNDPILRDLTILRFSQASNFPVPDRQWQRIIELASLT